MALGSPSKLLKQAKSILDSNPGLRSSEVFGDSVRDVVSEEVPENPRERRPALGHKRARFSFKPNKNHLSEILKPSIDIDNIKDPEEFFKAHERLENATREIQKQMGIVSFEPDQNNASTNRRQRRPGLMGNNQRSAVRYRHRYPVELSGQKEDIPLSQGYLDNGSRDPVDESPKKDDAHPASPSSELANSSAMEEKNLDNILDELLHTEDLEKDQAITFLQESLQIKPIVLEKLSIPDLPENRVSELKTLVGDFLKPRKPLNNINNLLREINKATPVKPRQNVGNTWQQSASPTPPRSPFAPLPSLQKLLSQSKPSADSFSAFDLTHSSPRNSPQSDTAGQVLKLGKPSDKLDGPLIKDIQSSVEKSVRNFATTAGISGEDNSGKPVFGPNIDSNESRLDLEVDARDRNTNKVIDDIVSKLNSEVDDPNFKEDNSTEPALGTNVDSNISHGDMEVDVGGIDAGNQIIHDSRIRANEPDEPAGKVQVQEVVSSEQIAVPELTLVNPQDQSGDAFFEANARDGDNNTADDGPRQILQAQENIGNPQVPVNKHGKVKSRKLKKKQLSRRQSLAAAGTSWRSGVRKSTRIRSRPLEYWKGERPLYGRVHESLVTLIGMKHMSPGTADGKPKLKVKSYVDNKKYKELLDLASGEL